MFGSLPYCTVSLAALSRRWQVGRTFMRWERALGRIRWKVLSGMIVFPPISVTSMLWSKQQRAFAVEAYFSNGCVDECLLSNVSKERKEPPKTVRTSGNVKRVRVSIQTGTDPPCMGAMHFKFVEISNVLPLVGYTRDFGDGPRNFEPWSSDVDDTVDMFEKVTQSFRSRLHQFFDNRR
ncbi:hypothetical protein TNCV_1427041 [Trichonephila clavipes]|nr:hypothetical protein TNCV_1427041 [Trichonephila clavipes]